MAQTDEVYLTERQQYWLEHLRACDAAGTTTIEYARTHGLNVKALYSARKGSGGERHLVTTSAPRFHKAQVASDPIRTDSQWHIQLPNGVVIAFGGGVDAKSLSLVLSTAANLS